MKTRAQSERKRSFPTLLLRTYFQGFLYLTQNFSIIRLCLTNVSIWKKKFRFYKGIFIFSLYFVWLLYLKTQQYLNIQLSKIREWYWQNDKNMYKLNWLFQIDDPLEGLPGNFLMGWFGSEHSQNESKTKEGSVDFLCSVLLPHQILIYFFWWRKRNKRIMNIN